MITLKQLAEKYNNQLEYRKRDNGEGFFCIKDHAHDEDAIRDLIRECHDGKMPDNYCYEYVNEALEAIGNYDDPEDYVSEIEADVYTSDLMKWMISHHDRKDLVNEMLSELGLKDIDTAIMYAQCKEKEMIFYKVVELLNEKVEELNSECEES